MSINLQNVKNIYFLGDGYGIRGGANYILCLINYLLDNTNISVGIIDLKDGYIKQNLNNKNIKFINYADSEWDIEPNSVIFCTAERLCLLKSLKDIKNRDTVKIITIIWETKIDWEILYPNSIRKKLANLLYKTKSLMFMDLGCRIATENKKQLNREFEPKYLPLYFKHDTDVECTDRDVLNINEYNIAWLGRLSDTKCFSLLNLINKYNNIKTDKKKKLHIIGDGLYKDTLLDRINMINDLNIEIVFKGVLTGKDLDNYLVQNADILFAMGTAMLNGASLKLPVAGVSETANPCLDLDKFIWLFNEEGLQVGLPDTEKLINKINPKATSLQNILDEVYKENKKQEIGNKCYEYYIEKHSDIKKSCELLLEYIAQSNLTYKDIQNLFRNLPFCDLLTTNIKILGIPVIKKLNIGISTTYKIFGIKLLKIVDNYWYKKYKLFGRFTICRIYRAGQYYFPNIFDKSLKNNSKKEDSMEVK